MFQKPLETTVVTMSMLPLPAPEIIDLHSSLPLIHRGIYDGTNIFFLLQMILSQNYDPSCKDTQ